MLKTITVANILTLIIQCSPKMYNMLEIGCGKGGIMAQIDDRIVPIRCGVDNYKPDLQSAQFTYPSGFYLQYDILKLMDIFLPKSFDLVIGFDILEHFTQGNSCKVISIAEQLAKKLVVFWFPLEKTLTKNPLPENPLQVHKRIMTTEEFDKREYEIIKFPHYWKMGRVIEDTEGCLAFRCL